MEVIVKDNEPLEVAIKRFRRECSRAGLMKEIRRRQNYTKPSEERRMAAMKARRKLAKKARRG
ncbi:MAG TPA: 30S ribosomal protein S21 [Phycisphaerales bacterium]|nr:30S ribosomal protein S21 [Phycisphaerales bacterium]